MKQFARLLLLIPVVMFSCNKNNGDENGVPERYRDEVFSSVNKSTILFDVQPDYTGTPMKLYADMYRPEGDDAATRAAIIYAHGGGNTRDDANIPYLCEELAKRGYLVASIDYRFGVEDESPAAKGRGRIRAVQDVKSFIRYAKQHAATAKIDVNRMFLTGSSAGGVAVLATTFLDFGEQPADLNPLTAADLQGYGNLNGQSASVNAVYSLWGAVGDTSWLKAGDTPVGCIHSIYDPTVPWDHSMDAGNGFGYEAYGSFSINRRAKNLGIYTSLYGFNSDKHSLGMNFPHIDTTIDKMTAFSYRSRSNLGVLRTREERAAACSSKFIPHTF